jgi:hypothetical protein
LGDHIRKVGGRFFVKTAPRLTRPFILQALIGLRKNKPKAGAKRVDVAQSADA